MAEKSVADLLTSQFRGEKINPKDVNKTESHADLVGDVLTNPNAVDEEPETEVELESEDETEQESESEDTEQEDDDDESELPESTKEILRKNRKTTREAEARAIKAEKALKALQEKKNDSSTEDNDSIPNDKFKNLYLASAAKTALVQAGFVKGTERFVKMLDLDSLEVDEDGNVSGLDDQVANVVDEFSDLLQAPEPKKRVVAKADAAGRRETPKAPMSSADRLAQQFKEQ